jgi:hypothetical protein
MFSNSQLQRLLHQHETIHELVVGLTEAQLRVPVNPGKWSAYENMAHLAAYQPAFLLRMQRLQQEQQPVFERYVADDDPAFAETVQLHLPRLFEKLRADRKQIIGMMLSLDDAGTWRSAIHPRYGKLSVIQWVEFFLLHEAHHLFTIFMLTSDLRKGG